MNYLEEVCVKLRKLDSKATVQIRETISQSNHSIFKVVIEVPALSLKIEGETPLGLTGNITPLEAGVRNTFEKLTNIFLKDKEKLETKLALLK